jgi:hypothetical protein
MSDYDVMVVGGGIGGIAAALAAARQGARVALLEKEYALGGLATLGLIVVYLPLDDGEGVQMSGGIAQELLELSVQDGPGKIPEVWARPADRESRRGVRYQVQYNAATLMINAEALLVREGVTLFYDARLASVKTENGRVKAVTVDTKLGPRSFSAAAFVDATGDGDLLFFAGEPTVDDDTNRRTGWYFGFDGEKLKLHAQTDPIYSKIPADSRTYSGTRLEDISQHMIDMRAMIAGHVRGLRERGEKEAYPLIIPAFHGLRMTRRLDGPRPFDADKHQGVWFEDAIGMIGNWHGTGGRYSLPYSGIKGIINENLYAAGRCTSAIGSGWDLTRVIPSCAVTGQAAGTAAAMQALSGQAPTAPALQQRLVSQGALLDRALFDREAK